MSIFFVINRQAGEIMSDVDLDKLSELERYNVTIREHLYDVSVSHINMLQSIVLALASKSASIIERASFDMRAGKVCDEHKQVARELKLMRDNITTLIELHERFLTVCSSYVDVQVKIND